MNDEKLPKRNANPERDAYRDQTGAKRAERALTAFAQDFARESSDADAGEAHLHRRIYSWLRAAILDGVLPGGMRLPPGRTLAVQLGVSRNTVTNAFDQLLAEGFIEGRPGSGTFVVELPTARGARDVAARKNPARTPRNAGRSTQNTIGASRRGTTLAALRATRSRSFTTTVAFGPGIPALDCFPYDEFARLTTKVYRELSATPAFFGYAAPGGVPELREAIAMHLRIDRGVRCEARQIVVVNGSQQGLDLCARILLDPGDVAFVEDPGYLGARGALGAAGARIVGVPVDAQTGLDLNALKKIWRAKNQRALIYITPSHQFPFGMTMSLAQRLELLDFARESGLWILEDDYDSEYRYTGRPISALQGLDESGEQVVYVGTFSKVLAPGLRLGYLVLPPHLVDAFVTVRALLDRQPAAVTQLAVARLMNGGGFHRHLRRMRDLYIERRAALLAGIDALPGRPLRALPTDTGLFVTATFAPEYLTSHAKSKLAARAGRPLDQVISERAAAVGVDLPALSNYYLRPDSPASLHGFLFGFASYDVAEMREGFRKLARIL